VPRPNFGGGNSGLASNITRPTVVNWMKRAAGKIPVASDADGSIAKAFDLKSNAGKPGMKDSRGEDIDHDFTERTTFVIKQDHTIAATFSSADDKITPAQHVEKSLDVVKQLAAKK
jgi:peroxiredoxin